MMTKYVLCTTTKEYTYNNRYKIKKGCTLDSEDLTVSNMFDDLESAKQFFKKFHSHITLKDFNKVAPGINYIVVEFSLREFEIDNDGVLVREIFNHLTSDFDTLSCMIIR